MLGAEARSSSLRRITEVEIKLYTLRITLILLLIMCINKRVAVKKSECSKRMLVR